MKGSFVHSLILHWCAEIAKPFPIVHFIHFDSSFIFSYLVLHYSFIFNPIRWMIPKKSLIGSLMLLLRFRKKCYHYFIRFDTTLC